MRITPENIQDLKENEIFVFGSNEAGIHGAGAALLAYDKFGAIEGMGFGLQGQSFAIPTKDWEIETLSLPVIQFYVTRFLECASKERNTIFLVTQIGCGLAGFSPSEIAPLFERAIPLQNIHLPKSFWEILQKHTKTISNV